MGCVIKTSSSFKFNKFLLNSLTVQVWILGWNFTDCPAGSTLTLVEVAPYPIPLLWILTETILPDELSSGVNFASVPSPKTTKSGGEL